MSWGVRRVVKKFFSLLFIDSIYINEEESKIPCRGGHFCNEAVFDVYLNKTKEVELTRAGLLDFDEYIDFKVDTDADGEIYPDILGELERGSDDKKKKGKDGKMPLNDESKMSMK